MKQLLLCVLASSTLGFGQLTISNPMSLTGYLGSSRTVHFSADEKSIYSDWEDLVQWSIETRKITSITPVPGYTTNKSAFDGKGIWINGNSNYNTSKKDITDMHANMNIFNFNEMKSIKTSKHYGVGAIVPDSSVAIMFTTNKKYQYEVVLLNLETQEESIRYFSEANDGMAVPTAIELSSDGKMAAISFAGDGRGMRVYSVDEGKLLAHIKTDEDANDIHFSGDNQFVYFNDGSKLTRVDKETWKVVKKWDLGKTITTFDADPIGRYVVAAFQRKGAILFDTATGEIIKELTNSQVFDATYSNSGKYIALGMKKTLMVEDVPSVLLFELGQ